MRRAPKPASMVVVMARRCHGVDHAEVAGAVLGLFGHGAQAAGARRRASRLNHRACASGADQPGAVVQVGGVQQAGSSARRVPAQSRDRPHTEPGRQRPGARLRHRRAGSRPTAALPAAAAGLAAVCDSRPRIWPMASAPELGGGKPHRRSRGSAVWSWHRASRTLWAGSVQVVQVRRPGWWGAACTLPARWPVPPGPRAGRGPLGRSCATRPPVPGCAAHGPPGAAGRRDGKSRPERPGRSSVRIRPAAGCAGGADRQSPVSASRMAGPNRVAQGSRPCVRWAWASIITAPGTPTARPPTTASMKGRGLPALSRNRAVLRPRARFPGRRKPARGVRRGAAGRRRRQCRSTGVPPGSAPSGLQWPHRPRCRRPAASARPASAASGWAAATACCRKRVSTDADAGGPSGCSATGAAPWSRGVLHRPTWR
jgi:hypothetical protein